MAVSYGGGTTAVAYGTTSLSVALPASGIVAGDYLVILVGTKPTTATINTPSGWTKLGELASSKGVSAGNDVGDTKIAALGKVADGSESGTSVTVSITSGNTSWGCSTGRWSNGTGAWDIDVATGQDTTAGTAWSATMSPDLPARSGTAGFVTALCIPTNVSTPSQFGYADMVIGSTTLVAPTNVDYLEIAEPDSSTSYDIGGWIARWITVGDPPGGCSGTATVAATVGGTTTNVYGPTVLVRLMEQGGGTNYTATPTDSAAGSDIATDALDAVRTPTDSAPASDTADALRTTDRSVSDAAGATDDATAQLTSPQNYSANPADSAGGTDSVTTGGIAYDRTPSDAAGATDATSTATEAARAAADPAGAGDILNVTATLSRTSADTASGNDATATTWAASRPATDTAAGSDTIGITATLARGLADTASASDSAVAALASSGSQALSDAVLATDAATTALDTVRATGDGAEVTDNASAESGLIRPWGDTAGAIDEVTAVMERIVTVDDLLALIDAADGALTGALTPIDTPPCHITVIPRENRTTVVPRDDRRTIVPTEDRRTVIPAESRLTAIPAEDRTTRIGACP